MNTDSNTDFDNTGQKTSTTDDKLAISYQANTQQPDILQSEMTQSAQVSESFHRPEPRNSVSRPLQINYSEVNRQSEMFQGSNYDDRVSLFASSQKQSQITGSAIRGLDPSYGLSQFGNLDSTPQIVEEMPKAEESRNEQTMNECSVQNKIDSPKKLQKSTQMDQKKEQMLPRLFDGQQVISNSFWISRVFFCWLGPLMRYAYKHNELTVQKYGIIGDKEKVDKQIENLREKWLSRIARGPSNNSLILSIFDCYKWDLAYLMTCNFFSILLQLMQPLFLFFLIEYVKDGVNQLDQFGIHFYNFNGSVYWIEWLTQSRQYGLALGFCLLTAQFFQFMIDENLQYTTNLVGAKSSNGLIGLIYEKQTKIYSSNKEGFTSGQIINFIQTDANKLFFFIQSLALVATMPLLLVAALSLLFYLLGWTFISGIVVFAISFYVNAKLAKVSAGFQKPYMQKQDQRVGLTTEALNNIKMLKLYSWIDTIQNNIKQRRNEELFFYKKRLKLGMLVITSLYFFPSSLQAVCYSFFIGFGSTLSLNTGYVVLSIFNLISNPIRELPLFIGWSVEFAISMRRIQKFLMLAEINTSVVTVSSKTNSEYPNISIRISPNSNFFWTLKENKAQNETDHKNILEQRKKSKKGKKGGKKDVEERLLMEQSDGAERSASNNIGQDQDIKQITLRDVMCLKNIEFEVEKGQFVCVIGDVAAGKSSLLGAILGELQYLDSKFVEENGHRYLSDEKFVQQIEEAAQIKHLISPVQINESLSFVQQTPWIQNKTIKENILFGLEYNNKKYKQTIKLCELSRDLEILPAGDDTEIGEKGINLSGGQKARIGLARAVYANRDLILMDDPISALDANVKKSIFNNVMLKHLKNKTRILVTHAVDFLDLVDTVVVVKNGEIVLKGVFKDIQNDSYLQQLLKIHKTNQNDQIEIQQKDNHPIIQKLTDDSTVVSPLPNILALPSENHENNPEDKQNSQGLLDTSQLEGQGQLKVSQYLDLSAGPEDNSAAHTSISDQHAPQGDRKQSGKIMSDEQDEKIQVTFGCYYDYFKNYYGGLKFFTLGILSMSMFLASKMSADYLVGNWAQQADQRSNFKFYCGLSFAFAVAQGIFIYCRAACMQLFGLKATRKLHERMIERILRAPVNLYYDTTPIGRILNKFSKDLNQIESGFSYILGGVFVMVFLLMYSVVVGIIVLPYLALLLPVIAFFSYLLLTKSKNGIKESVRLVSTTKSPLLSHLGETITGCPTLRAFGCCDKFIQKNKEYLNQNILAIQFQAAVSAWFGIRIDIFALIIMMVLTVVVVLAREEDGSNAIVLSMLMTSTLNIQQTLTMLLNFWMTIETQMVNVVRCMRLCQVIQESQIINHNGQQFDSKQSRQQQDVSNLLQGRSLWPENGQIEFRNVYLKYRPDTEIVLKDLSFKVNPGEKIGVVGRTGAGKSTICLGISRIVELHEGQIFIDGIDISQIRLDDLRSRITVIPQDPTMFSGSLRFNLDPEENCSDEVIVDLLQKANLQNMLESDPKGLLQQINENGSNLSSGQRQLICICRAILRKSKLVVLDEATANIDVITEQNIQKLINTQFGDATMIVIAHRINTIIQSDRVLVLSFGQIQEFDSPSALMANAASEFSKLIKDLKKEQQEKN